MIDEAGDMWYSDFCTPIMLQRVKTGTAWWYWMGRSKWLGMGMGMGMDIRHRAGCEVVGRVNVGR